MPGPYPLEFRREAVELLKRSGKSVPQLSAELGVSPQSLRNWARQIDVDAGRFEGPTSDEREELRRLRREVKTLPEEREILKSAVFFAKDGGSRSGFHAWAGRAPSAWAVTDATLTGRIAEIHAGSMHTYRSPRVHAELRLDDGIRLDASGSSG